MLASPVPDKHRRLPVDAEERRGELAKIAAVVEESRWQRRSGAGSGPDADRRIARRWKRTVALATRKVRMVSGPDQRGSKREIFRRTCLGARFETRRVLWTSRKLVVARGKRWFDPWKRSGAEPSISVASPTTRRSTILGTINYVYRVHAVLRSALGKYTDRKVVYTVDKCL